MERQKRAVEANGGNSLTEAQITELIELEQLDEKQADEQEAADEKG